MKTQANNKQLASNRRTLSNTHSGTLAGIIIALCMIVIIAVLHLAS